MCVRFSSSLALLNADPSESVRVVPGAILLTWLFSAPKSLGPNRAVAAKLGRLACVRWSESQLNISAARRIGREFGHWFARHRGVDQVVPDEAHFQNQRVALVISAGKIVGMKKDD